MGYPVSSQAPSQSGMDWHLVFYRIQSASNFCLFLSNLTPLLGLFTWRTLGLVQSSSWFLSLSSPNPHFPHFLSFSGSRRHNFKGTKNIQKLQSKPSKPSKPLKPGPGWWEFEWFNLFNPGAGWELRELRAGEVFWLAVPLDDCGHCCLGSHLMECFY